jgi:Putative Ig domain
MRRVVAAVTGLVLAVSAALVALSVAPGKSSAVAGVAATGKVTVVIRAPRGVAANAILKGPRKVVFAKPASGRREQVTRRLPVGRYRVRPETVVSQGVLYAGTPHRPVRVAAGHPVRITVRFSKVPSASSLHANRITATEVKLAWSAPNRATFALRRSAGSQPATSRRAGLAVHVTGRRAVDRHLRAGRQYSYALFTRSHRHWIGPVTLTLGTRARSGSKRASFAAQPGTLLATSADVGVIATRGTGMQVTLSPGVSTPVLGSSVTLPRSASLPGGYIGQVSGISADGSTVTLEPASLSSAFSYYDVNVPDFTTAATALVPRVASHANGARRASSGADCGGSASGTVTFSPSLRLGGSFDAAINTTRHLSIPKGASLSMRLTAAVTGAMSVETSASLSCELTFGEVFKTITVDPVPISVLLTPAAQISVDGADEESNLGATATGGVQFSGTLGVHRGAHFSGSDIATAQPLTPVISHSGSVSVKLGGELTVGPGAGTDDAGVIAGLSGELDPLSATFGPAFPQAPNTCFKTSAQLLLQLGLSAKAWLKSWSIDRKIEFSALTAQPDYPGSPWYSPSGCENSAPLTVSSGTLPDGQVSILYDQTLSASGGTEPYDWAVVGGSLPDGLTLSHDGELSGTPISPGTSQFTVQVTDQDGNTATRTLSLTISPAQTAPEAISEYDVSPDLGCAMFNAQDANGEFYGDHACGTIIAVGGQLYGPSDIPAGGNLTGSANYNSWDPASQTTSGSGTATDPFVITTGASADGSSVTVSQSDTYAVGGSTVKTTTTLTNTSGSPIQLTLYHAFDCFPGNSDTGTGTSSGGSVSCVSDNVTNNGARTLRLRPGTNGSTYVEEHYADLWSDTATGNLYPDTVRADDHDTAEGLGWQITIPASSSVSVQYDTDLLLTQ